MVLPAQLLDLARMDAQRPTGGGVAARSADKNAEQRFSLMLDVNTHETSGIKGKERMKTADKPSPAGSSKARRRDGQEQDYQSASALTQASQPAANQTDDAAAAEQTQDAPALVTLNTAIVDILEGVGLLNTVDVPANADETPAYQPEADDDGTDVVKTAADAVQSAADDIEYVSGRQSDPLEHVSSIAMRIRHALNERPPIEEPAAPQSAVEGAEAVPAAPEDEQAASADGETGNAGKQPLEANTRHETRRTELNDDGVTGARFAHHAARPVDTPPPQVGADAVARLRSSVLTQAAESVENMLGQGQSTLTIQMKPEFLGHLAIELTMGKDGLSALIRSNDAGVRSLLGAELEALTQSLKEKGITVANVQVAQQEMADLAGQYFQDRSMARQGFTGSTAGRTHGAAVDSRLADEAAGTDALAAFMEASPEMLGASVEFSA